MSRLLISFIWLFVGFSAFGQVLPVQPAASPAIPAPAPAPNPPAPSPATPAPPTIATAEPTVPLPAEETAKLQFPNADVKEVLSYYERLTGKKIVADNTVLGPVNIIINTPVSREEAVRIIEINLLLNGFSLVPASGNIMKVIGVGKNARTAAVPIYSELAQVPDSERVITFLFKLQYIDAQELQQTMAQYIAPSPYTSVVALQKSHALLVTDNSSVIRGVDRIIREIDVPPAEVVSEFIALERADAKDVIEKIEKILEKPQTPGVTAAPATPAAQPPPIPGVEGAKPTSVELQGGGLSEDSIIIGKIKLTADIRTNRIHVITRPINLPFIRKIIHEFDLDVPFGEPSKRALKFISASDVLPVVVKAITEPGVKAEDSSGGTGGAGNTGANQRNTQQNNYNNGSSFGQNGSGGGMNVSEDLQTQPVDTTPKAVTVGNTKIIADPRENTIIVLGNKEVQQKVFQLLDEMDVRAPQVMLNTVIGNLTLNDDNQFGIDYLLNPNNMTTGSGGASIANMARQFAITSFGTPLAASAASALGVGSGISGVISPNNSLDIIVHALESTGRFHVTQRPMVFTSNNKKAIIASGEQIAVPTSTLSNLNNGSVINNTASVQSSIQYYPVELKLEVVPLINSDREVSLDIVQTLNQVSGSNNISGSNVPNISTRYIKTNVSVPNRSTIVLGGLITKTVSTNASGVPYLSRIPVLGYLFKNTSKQNDREELIILIRPVVTNSPAETVGNSEAEQHRLMIEPDIESTIGAKKPPSETGQKKPVNFRYKE